MSYQRDPTLTSKLIHTKQREAFDDKARFKFILAGRRGGKTRLIREDIIQTLWDCPAGGEIFYIGPTLAHAYELIWDELDERLYQTKIKYTPRISKRRFEISGHRMIYVIGAEKIKRIRGHKVFKAYMDELAFFESSLEQVWKAVRPALSDLKGSAIVATTPNGKGTEAYDFYLNTLDKKDWKYFHWHTLDNPYIDPKEIDSAKLELDEKGFRQEYLASWESFEGLAYYNFNESIHVKPQEFDPSLNHIAICMDFNVNPTTLVVAQHYPNFVRVLQEFSLKNSSTIETAQRFVEEYKDKKDNLIEIYGDASGNNRSHGTGKSDYYYLEDVLAHNGFRYKRNVPARNPHPPDRVGHVNSWLKNVKGEHRIEIDPSCRDVIRDLGSQELEGRYPSGKNNLGHKLDSLGYLINWKQVLSQRGDNRQIQL